MDRSIDSIGSCSLDADSTDFSGNFWKNGKKFEGNGKSLKHEKNTYNKNNCMKLDDCLARLIKSRTCTYTHN